MALVRWNPFDFDRFLDEEFLPSRLGQSRFGRIFTDVAVDIYEQENHIVAKMNLPGIDPGDIEVSVEDDYLKISGQRKEEKEEEKKDYYYKEIQRGSFERSVRLPKKVISEQATAEFKDGVLKIVVPIAEEERKRKKIEIKTNR